MMMKTKTYAYVRLALFSALGLGLLLLSAKLQAQGAAAPVDAGVAAGQAAAAQEAQHGWVSQVFGPAMWVLWACSIALVAAILNRFRAMKRTRVLDEAMMRQVAKEMGELRVDDAVATAAKSPTLVGQAWAKALREYQLGGVSLGGVLTDASSLVLKPLRQHLWLITTIGVIAPMFGLIGTVVGMILTFSTLAETGGADKAKLAVGLSFALYKTAGGLIVAIPAIVFGRYFAARVIGYAEEVEASIHQVCYEHSHGLANQHRQRVADALPAATPVGAAR